MRLIDGSLAAIVIALDTATQAAGAAVVTATATATRVALMVHTCHSLDRFHCSGPTLRMLDRKREAKV